MIYATVILLATFWAVPAYSNDNLKTLSVEFPNFHQLLFAKLGDQQVNPSYEFDASRDPVEALKEGKGGHCNMHAQVAAYALMKQGIQANDLRIVSSVENVSLNGLCRHMKGKAALNPRDGLRGHVFLLLKSGDKWYLVNTTTVPKTPPARPFGELGLEFVPFVSPEELDEKMKLGPVSVPREVTKSLPSEIFGNMTFFHSVAPDSFPLHEFSDRRKLIASGSTDSDICRYDGALDAPVAIETPPVPTDH